MFQGEIVPEQENFITWYVKNAEGLNGINTRDFFNLLNEYPISSNSAGNIRCSKCGKYFSLFLVEVMELNKL